LILLRAVNFEKLRLVDACSVPDINILQNAGGGGGYISVELAKKSEQR